MKKDTDHKTKLGRYAMDDSGLWHYHFESPGTFSIAAEDAIKHRPDYAAWFWFNDTPCPIFRNDSGRDLGIRWGEWRQKYHAGGNDILPMLLELSGR